MDINLRDPLLLNIQIFIRRKVQTKYLSKISPKYRTDKSISIIVLDSVVLRYKIKNVYPFFYRKVRLI